MSLFNLIERVRGLIPSREDSRSLKLCGQEVISLTIRSDHLSPNIDSVYRTQSGDLFTFVDMLLNILQHAIDFTKYS